MKTPAENANATETTGAFSADVLSPSRIQASFFYSREDRARFVGMDMALRENLSMALADGLDDQVISGTNGLLTGTNLANHNVNSETSFANYKSQFLYGRVDGEYANGAGDNRLALGAASYAHAAGQYRATENNFSALDVLMAAAGGVRVSAHVPVAANSKQTAVVRLGMRRDMVAPIWEGVTLIPDEITKAGTGQIVVTAVMLYAVAILRADGFHKQQVQIARCEATHKVTPGEMAETGRWCALADRPFLRMEVERLAREGAVAYLLTQGRGGTTPAVPRVSIGCSYCCLNSRSRESCVKYKELSPGVSNAFRPTNTPLAIT